MKKIFIYLFFILFLFSCGQETKKSGNLSISDNGIKIDVWNQKMNISWTGIDIDLQWNKLQVSDWWINISLASLWAWNNNLSAEDLMQFWNLAKEKFESSDCEQQFNQLVKTFWNNYDTCFLERKKPINCQANVKIPKVNIAVIFDASWSMWAKIWNETMMEIAKDELSKYVSSLDENIWWWVILYWHKWNSTQAWMQESCIWIENIWNFSDSKQELISKISSLKPNWWTPIDESLKKADEYLKSISWADDQKIILLISDGKETCWGNPVETAKKIASDKNTYIDVIWFNVNSSVQSELLKIAENGWWKYRNVKSRSDFVRVFADMKAFSQEIQCAASDASIQLRQAVDNLNTFYLCSYMAHEEEVKVVTNASQSCINDVARKMEERRTEIEEKLETIEKQAIEDIYTFSDNMKEVIKKFE